MEWIKYVKADMYRYTGTQSNTSFLKTYLNCEGFRFTFWLRICHFSRKSKVLKFTIFPFFRLVFRHYRVKYGYDIPYTNEIGPGLLLYHFGGVVFSARYAGKNLTISQNVTVGMTVHAGVKTYPIFGDNVYLGPQSSVIGDVKISDHVAVGNSCVVTKSAEPYSVLVGIPGKVVSHNGSAEYVNNPVS